MNEAKARRSQLLSTYGVGGLVPFGDNEFHDRRSPRMECRQSGSNQRTSIGQIIRSRRTEGSACGYATGRAGNPLSLHASLSRLPADRHSVGRYRKTGTSQSAGSTRLT